ncbi:MAG: 2-C-methyl-D-erythritol 2,4-cyclodiphosphate synthase [Chloroflexota bacterium]
MFRVGLGYDIHRTSRERALVLGGVEIEEGPGLDGHSDADVVVHAVMDALLGAAGLPDIGVHFPPTDEAYRGASSLKMLDLVVQRVHASGYRLVNIDIVVVAERPKIAPYAELIRERLDSMLGIGTSFIGLKATTTEGTGPEGRGEAMSAQAIALIESLP